VLIADEADPSPPNRGIASTGGSKETIGKSTLRADSAHVLVDLAVANPSFTVRKVSVSPGVSYDQADLPVRRPVELAALEAFDASACKRRSCAQRVSEFLASRRDA
jgi:hypothetical protein